MTFRSGLNYQDCYKEIQHGRKPKRTYPSEQVTQVREVNFFEDATKKKS